MYHAFLDAAPPDFVLSTYVGGFECRAERVRVPLADALGRPLADDVSAPSDLPGFTRSTVDGYAVHAADTFGATESNPIYLDLAGSVAMASIPRTPLRAGTTVEVPTGGALPRGADAVVMLEHTGRFGDDYAAMCTTNTFYGPYPSIGDDIVRSIFPRERVRSNWMGYSKTADALSDAAWRMVMKGMDSIWWWMWDGIGTYRGWVRPTMDLWPATAEVDAEMRPVRQGLGVEDPDIGLCRRAWCQGMGDPVDQPEHQAGRDH